MKQSKKLTRNQRNFLEKNNIDTEGVRFIQETPSFFEYITKDGSVKRLNKHNNETTVQ